MILLSGPAPLGIAPLLVAVEKSQTELDGLDIVELVRRMCGTPCFPPPPNPIMRERERMHGCVKKKIPPFLDVHEGSAFILDYLLPVGGEINSHLEDNPPLLRV